jgi:hypothetical protein
MSRPSEVYVCPLSAEEEQWVHRLYHQSSHVGLKSRCHMILLSVQHYRVPLFLSIEGESCSSLQGVSLNRHTHEQYRARRVVKHKARYVPDRFGAEHWASALW